MIESLFDGVVFEPWQKIECDDCGFIFQITRTEGKTVFGEIICSDCSTYKKGYKDGYKSKQDEK